jgi:GTP cyclohydrolase I
MEFKQLPDVAAETDLQAQREAQKSHLTGLAWVGMDRIQMPLLWDSQILGSIVLAQVNLKPGLSRGIHMSRLYSLLAETLPIRSLSWSVLQTLVAAFIKSQNGLSDRARLKVNFQLPLRRKALKSDLVGWRLYPVEMAVIGQERAGKIHFEKILRTEVLYSSTCPASTALSRELWRDQLAAHFGQESNLPYERVDQWFESQVGMPGTPHAQRSRAELEVELAPHESSLGPVELIEALEDCLKTPVQTAVKRVDEQEFARLNGQNTMFCEDAARRVQQWLETRSQQIPFYRGTFEHQESLHPHNATAHLVKSKFEPGA